MNTHALPHRLSPARLASLRITWLDDDRSITSVDVDRRMPVYQDVARALASRAKKQLIGCGAETVADWLRHRSLIMGYLSGMSEAILLESGETSRCALTLMSLSALLALLGTELDEDEIHEEAQRLWMQLNLVYLAGVRAADIDHSASRRERVSTGLAEAVQERERQVA